MDKAVKIKEILNKEYKDAKCTLNYNNLYQLVVAVMLSAQTTDAKVNKVTASLFSCYPTILDIANAKKEDICKILFPLGLAKTKTENLINLSNVLIEKYDSKVPSCKEELMKLPGVGNKTTQVVLAEGFKINAFPVDTHVFRVSKRLGLTNQKDDVLETEKKLKSLFKEEDWISLHHQIIQFGREVCTSKNPKCERCKLKDLCVFKKYE